MMLSACNFSLFLLPALINDFPSTTHHRRLLGSAGSSCYVIHSAMLKLQQPAAPCGADAVKGEARIRVMRSGHVTGTRASPSVRGRRPRRPPRDPDRARVAAALSVVRRATSVAEVAGSGCAARRRAVAGRQRPPAPIQFGRNRRRRTHAPAPRVRISSHARSEPITGSRALVGSWAAAGPPALMG